MKHIGILAHSAEGSALCYLTAVHEASCRLGPHMHPDITLDVIAMGKSMAAWEQQDFKAVRAILLKTANRLAAAGCDFFVCPDNTAHMALEVNGEPLALPGLHIAEVVAKKAAADGFKKIGVLATKWTMEGPVYGDAFGRIGCQTLTPSPEDMTLLDQIIFDELCNGIINEGSRNECLRMISGFAEKGCDAVVLGCTEIPLLVTPEISPLPTLDSTRLLAIAAVDAAMGIGEAPKWRGGTVAKPE